MSVGSPQYVPTCCPFASLLPKFVPVENAISVAAPTGVQVPPRPALNSSLTEVLAIALLHAGDWYICVSRTNKRPSQAG